MLVRNLNKKTESSGSLVSEKLFKLFIYILPLTLFFSYFPVISFGADEAMNFEFSLPLIWLVIFDLLVFFMMIKWKILFKGFRKKLVWLLFPGFLSLSVLWSFNSVRGVLTVGILWLLYFAIYGMWNFRKLFDGNFREKFLKWFFISSLVICGWCFLQCILDLVGVSRDYTLMCAGCTYKMFGFPHPNGFAIEPQFMGNLLLAPAIVVAWLILSKQSHENDNGSHFLYSEFLLFSGLFIIIMTLFLTFSRGAIYAFIVAMIFMSSFMMARENQKGRGKMWKRVGVVWVTVVLSFLFTLNLQGIFAQVSPTNDTYFSGIASTKAFTSQVVAMVIFGLTIAQAKGVKPGILKPYIKEIAKLPEEIRKVLNEVAEPIEKIAKENHIETAITAVGDSNVAEAMREKNIQLGGEQSGHIILPGEATGDGILTSLMITKILSETGEKLSELASIITKLPQVIINLPATKEQKEKLKSSDIVKQLLLDYHKKLEPLSGRLLVRPSGTENLIRITMWGNDENAISNLANELKNKLGEIL